MKLGFRVVFRQSLNDSDRQPVFSMVEGKNFLTRCARLLLFPVKNFFYVWVPNDCDALVVVKKPLNDVRNGIEVGLTGYVTPQGWRGHGGIAVWCWFCTRCVHCFALIP